MKALFRAHSKKIIRLSCFLIVLCAIVCAPLLSSAHTPTASITIVNNSNWVITHVYLSHTDQDDWSNDQLNDVAISAGDSRTLSNVTWDQPDIEVITEDQDGCFLSNTVQNSSGQVVTITSNATPNCGN